MQCVLIVVKLPVGTAVNAMNMSVMENGALKPEKVHTVFSAWMIINA